MSREMVSGVKYPKSWQFRSSPQEVIFHQSTILHHFTNESQSREPINLSGKGHLRWKDTAGLRNVTGPAGDPSQDPSNQSRRSSMTGGHRGNGRTDRLYRTPLPDTTTESSDICTPSHGGAHSSCGRRRRRKSESSYTRLLCSLFTCLWRSSLMSSSSISLNKILRLETWSFCRTKEVTPEFGQVRGV